ncbi:MAG: hypothetical protein GW911_08510 [Armatimonadetes bacterium]|nr:hypothetical protein [Armatimonadota bacterium]NDK12079.1 hypothetical protein [Armatimonadota bacterium]
MRLRSVVAMALAVSQLSLFAVCVAAEEAAPEKGKVSLWIFENQIRAAAPGIDRAIKLNDEQKKKLETAYNEVFSAESVQAASAVLQNKESTLAERQEAGKAVGAARAAFLKRCNDEVFTPEQNEQITKIYAAYNEVRVAAQKELAQKIVTGFGEKLGTILSPEQKDEVAKGKAEFQAAVKAAIEKQKEQQAAKEKEAKKE